MQNPFLSPLQAKEAHAASLAPQINDGVSGGNRRFNGVPAVIAEGVARLLRSTSPPWRVDVVYDTVADGQPATATLDLSDEA